MLNVRDYNDRKIRAAVREIKKLSTRQYRTIQLEKPIQVGWRRFYVLSAHAQTRRDRPILEAILKVVGTVVRHHDRMFLKRQGRCRKLLDIEQPLRPIPVYEWERKGYPDEWLRYFRWELVLVGQRCWQPSWVFKQASIFELKIRRYWVTAVTEPDPDVQSRICELERWLESRDGQQRYDWLKGCHQACYRTWSNRRRRQRLEREEKREIHRAYRDFPEVDPAVSTRRSRLSFRQMIFIFPRRSPTQRQRVQNSSSAGAS